MYVNIPCVTVMYWYSNLCTSKDTFTTNDKCLEVSESC